jgi:hypothetical protein
VPDEESTNEKSVKVCMSKSKVEETEGYYNIDITGTKLFFILVSICYSFRSETIMPPLFEIRILYALRNVF